MLSVLRELKVENLNGKIGTQESISQLLWAARGRTPHLYKSKPWGMTIPTSRGEQKITSVYLILEGKLSRYVNWRWKGWAHSIEKIRDIKRELQDEIFSLFHPFNCQIILAENEGFSRALWESGYQLLNLMLQANACGLKDKAYLFGNQQKGIYRKCGIADPIWGLFSEYGS